IGKITFYASGNGANADGGTSGDNIYTSATPTFSGLATSDFNGDAASDIAVWRPSNGVWYSYSPSDGTYGSSTFGQSGDVITPGDYDGDGKTDTAVFRPSTGIWYVQQSTAGFMGIQFGTPGDVPV